MNWRTEGSQEAENRKVCPTCRKPSDYVVPSVKQALTPEEKEHIVSPHTRTNSRPFHVYDLRENSGPVILVGIAFMLTWMKMETIPNREMAPRKNSTSSAGRSIIIETSADADADADGW